MSAHQRAFAVRMQDARPGTLLLDRDGALWLRGSNRARCLADAKQAMLTSGSWPGRWPVTIVQVLQEGQR